MIGEKEIFDLQRFLKDEDYKTVMVLCLEPKSWGDIQKTRIKQSKLFQILKDLKLAKCLEFNGGKYCTAAFVKEYLK